MAMALTEATLLRAFEAGNHRSCGSLVVVVMKVELVEVVLVGLVVVE